MLLWPISPLVLFTWHVWSHHHSLHWAPCQPQGLCVLTWKQKNNKKIIHFLTVKDNSAGLKGCRLCGPQFVDVGPGNADFRRRQWARIESLAPRPNSSEESWQLESFWFLRWREKERQNRADTEQKVLVGQLRDGKALLTFSWSRSPVFRGTRIMWGCRMTGNSA